MDETINNEVAQPQVGQEPELEINLEEAPVEETVESLKVQLAERDALLAKEVEARRQLTARA